MNVLKHKMPELVVATVIGIFLLVISASLMYFVEHEAQPEQFSSIPATMWWAVSTLTTVGYGDMFPITPLGKFLGAFIAMLGLGLFALPAGIIASGFPDIIHGKLEADGPCPTCGHVKKTKEELPKAS